MKLFTDRSNLHITTFVTREELLQLLSGSKTTLVGTDPSGWQVEIQCPVDPMDVRAKMFRQGQGGRLSGSAPLSLIA